MSFGLPIVLVAAVCALVGLGVAVYFAMWVLKQEVAVPEMVELSKAIQQGAMAFLTREYRAVAVVLVAVAVIMTVVLKQPLTGIAYLVGACFSGTAGFIGLYIATRANARTTSAARNGIAAALPVAFRGGAVMGLTVAGLGLLGVSLSFLVWLFMTGFVTAAGEITSKTWTIFGATVGAKQVFEDIIPGFGLGASTIALFARVGGGIYTKAADVGADLVGKVEAGIPEDDPRNPAVIADNVGDNVGDVAGMGADLYESYVGAIVAPLALGSLVLGFRGALLPVLIAAVGILCSAAAAYFVKGKEGGHPGRSLSVGTYAAAGLTTVGCYFLVVWLLTGYSYNGQAVANPVGFFIAIIAGLAAGMAIGQVSEVYTSDMYSAVKEIAESAKTGPATVILSGISDGMRSTGWAIIILCAAMFGSYAAGQWAMPGGGIFAIGLSAIGMLATTGIVVAVDAYGPIADNAGGIAEMSHQPPEVREVTDSLDSAGNTTAAIAKGFAIASAAVTALAYFKLYAEKVSTPGNPMTLDILSIYTLIGLFLGGMFPFLFSSMAIKAVGRAAFKMVEEVRRQFKEIPGLREGREGVKADYARCVDISTSAALREMVIPATLTVVSPVVVGLWSKEALGGYLAGALVVGFLLAIFMANSGGAWDNAKKYIEGGALGGKGSDAHKAAVVGDTVGDPFKDTSGPSMNILIKVMSVVAVIFAPLFVR